MSSSNLPRHGDDLIKRVDSGIGTSKLIARPQFQQFLDELGALLDNTDTDISDLVQLFESQDANFQSKFSDILSQLKELQEAEQQAYSNESNLSSLLSTINGLKKTIESNNQLIHEQNATIDTLRTQSSKMNERIDSLEQLINVN